MWQDMLILSLSASVTSAATNAVASPVPPRCSLPTGAWFQGAVHATPKCCRPGTQRDLEADRNPLAQYVDEGTHGADRLREKAEAENKGVMIPLAVRWAKL